MVVIIVVTFTDRGVIKVEKNTDIMYYDIFIEFIVSIFNSGCICTDRYGIAYMCFPCSEEELQFSEGISHILRKNSAT